MSGQRGFVMVPAWLLIKKPTGNDVLTYCTLASHGTWNPGTGTYESCKPSIELMVEETSLSRSTIKRSLANLLGFGAINRTLQYTPEGDPAPSLYQVIFGQVVEPETDKQPEVGSQVTRPSKQPGKGRSRGGRSTPGPTSGHPGTDGRSTGEPTVGPPVTHNQEPLNQEPLNQDSAPASQVRRDADSTGDPAIDGQLTLDGGVEAITGEKEPTTNDVAMGIGRGWLAKRAEFDCPIVVRGKADPLMALRNVVLPALDAGYTETEIKYALMRADSAIPSAGALDTALAAVRRGWKAPKDWKPGDAAAGRNVVKQRGPGVNDHWKRRAQLVAAGAIPDDDNDAPSAARIQTEGGAW